jgi:LysM repeat protein
MSPTRAAVALAALAGFTLTVTPAAAAPPDPAGWSITDHHATVARGIATKPAVKPVPEPAPTPHTSQAPRQGTNGPSRARRHTQAQNAPQRAARRMPRWHAASTCRPTVRAGEERTWTVGPGDTLWLVARCHDVSVPQLRARNGIRRDAVLRVDQVLHIPAPVIR